ncbi:PREDICTED: uncharacterized protein LOC101364092 [Odobenus rosmarus divergens]|uniref:Uncharacterized protein LOC101364092 n=1 Tax=Odobenus rosmarus divergens TaxID=9708 RepID=A0A9B0GHI2_ODORO
MKELQPLENWMKKENFPLDQWKREITGNQNQEPGSPSLSQAGSKTRDAHLHFYNLPPHCGLLASTVSKSEKELQEVVCGLAFMPKPGDCLQIECPRLESPSFQPSFQDQGLTPPAPGVCQGLRRRLAGIHEPQHHLPDPALRIQVRSHFFRAETARRGAGSRDNRSWPPDSRGRAERGSRRQGNRGAQSRGRGRAGGCRSNKVLSLRAAPLRAPRDPARSDEEQSNSAFWENNPTHFAKAKPELPPKPPFNKSLPTPSPPPHTNVPNLTVIPKA